ncbi:UNVERIFIED_CONTAM: hypothetical protein Sradi_0200500 [Sesamum radiatum]|uniref:DDE Tnp4 domain-containing protein n=1 Tax=Sesamum radiatum TaxID=300843 RepID=A0AAW2W2D0_SESRA
MNVEIHIGVGLSAADGRVLQDAVHRSADIKVRTGNYYLCDNGYRNVEGFLTPYRGVRYHLKEWDQDTGGPQSHRELFNLRHASARNVIERMNLFDEDGSSKPRGCRAKADKGNTRRTWTQREEEVLVTALRNIVTMGGSVRMGSVRGI